MKLSELGKSYHSNQSKRAVLGCGTVYHLVQIASNFESMDEISVNIRTKVIP